MLATRLGASSPSHLPTPLASSVACPSTHCVLGRTSVITALRPASLALSSRKADRDEEAEEQAERRDEIDSGDADEQAAGAASASWSASLLPRALRRHPPPPLAWIRASRSCVASALRVRARLTRRVTALLQSAPSRTSDARTTATVVVTTSVDSPAAHRRTHLSDCCFCRGSEARCGRPLQSRGHVPAGRDCCVVSRFTGSAFRVSCPSSAHSRGRHC